MTVTPSPVTAKPDPKRPWKAVASFVGTFILALWTTTKDRTDLDTMTTSQWLLVVLGSLATAVLVYGVPNPTRLR